MSDLAGKPRSKFYDDVGTNPRAVKRQEKRVAHRVGGHRQPGSGAFEWAKGDVAAKDLMVSAKRTKHRSISITEDMLLEIERIALAKSCAPAMAIELDGMDPRLERDWVLCPMRLFERMLEVLRDGDS